MPVLPAFVVRAYEEAELAYHDFTESLSSTANQACKTITESRAYKALFYTPKGRAFVGFVMFGGLATACVLTGGLPLIAAVALPIILKGGVAAVVLQAGTVIGCAAIGGVGGAFWHRHEVRWLTGAAFGVLGGALVAPLAAFPAAYVLVTGGFLGFGVGITLDELAAPKLPLSNDLHPSNPPKLPTTPEE